MNTGRLLGYIRLMRPANLPTAMADILAGSTLAGAAGQIFANGGLEWATGKDLLVLLSASVLLYAGGVVLNDVFDRELDKTERPERPIPSGLIFWKNAAVFGFVLLTAGVALSFLVNIFCGVTALILAGAILTYDVKMKHFKVWGPVNMGICRGLNLLLGMSIFGVPEHWWVAVIPVLYIAAITLISQGEVHGKNKNHILIASGIYALVIFLIIGLSGLGNEGLLQTIPYLILFAFLIYKPLIKAFKENSSANIKKAVKAGVISLIVMDACIAVGFSQWWFGMVILALLPLSVFLSKQFAVT